MIANVATQRVIERILCPICRASNRADARFCQQCGNDVLLDNIYRITRVIKEGGMGVVYQAIDGDGEVYAIKEMHDRFTDAKEREEGIERFVDEAKLLRTLRGHPNIPNVYRSFIDEGRYYLAMEFIFGEDLEDILKRQSRFPEAQVLRWADQLCDVLEYMHSHGLIYRDMKPSNVMITQEGEVKVVDFGIAKLLQPGQRGTMVGTPGYAPPEQYQGLVSPQSDEYALAATLHHLLTGRDPREEPPFSFPPARDVRNDISRQTSDALAKALQMEVADRYKTIGEFRAALPILKGERRPAPQTPAPRSTGTTRRTDVAPVPAAKPAPQPRPVQPRAVQPRPAQQSQPVAPRRQQRPQQRRRRGTAIGRATRRLVATAAITAGLYFGAATVAPEALANVQSYVTNVVQEYLAPDAAPGTEQVVPAAGFALQRSVTVQVTEGASETEILDELRNGFLAEARKSYPAAQLVPDELPTIQGPRTDEAIGGGYVRVTALMDGRITTQ